MRRILYICCIALTTISLYSQDFRERDSLALIALYNATDGPNWVNQWDLSTPISTWYGIITNQEGCVTSLTLTENNLTGIIPEAIGSLINLRNLNLYSNNLSGEISDTIGNLKELSSLNFSQNILSSEIPNSIGKLGNLLNLNLSYNNLTGNIDDSVFDLEYLVTLSLNNNNLIGNIPIPGNQLNQIYSINISNNQIAGCIPIELASKTSLKILHLNNNLLECEIPTEILEMDRIYWLDLQHNKFSGQITSINMDSISFLNLSNNSLSGSLPIGIFNSSVISSIELDSNNFSGCIPEDYFSFCGDQFIDLNIINSNCQDREISSFSALFSNALGNNISVLYPFTNSCRLNLLNDFLPNGGDMNINCLNRDQIFAECYDRSTLTVNDRIDQNCECVGELLQNNRCDDDPTLIGTPCDDGRFDTFDDIIDTNCNCVGFVPSCDNDAQHLYSLFEQCDGENWLYFDFENNVPDLPFNWDLSIPLDDWVRVTNIRGCVTGIFLNGYNILRPDPQTGELVRRFQPTGVNGFIPEELQNLEFLQFIDITSDSLQGSIPDYFGDFRHILSLNLRGNALDSVIPTSLNKLNTLEHLNLDFNNFISPIPLLDSLDNLRTYSIAGNSFDQAIPEYICEYDSLRSLNIGYNNFSSAPILECLQDLTYLTSLNIPSINATGPIPSWICEFDFLTNLDIGSNPLEGELLSCLGELDSLRSLDASSSNLVGDLPSELCNLEFLSNFRLNNNQFNSNLDPCFHEFDNLGIVNLSGNKLSGRAIALNNNDAFWYYISDNCFDELPDLSQITGWTRTFTAVITSNNKFTFEDLLINQTLFTDTTISTIYAPQAQVFHDTTIQVPKDGRFNIDLGFDEGITTNQYQWFRDGEPLRTINGNNEFTIENVSFDDEGVYHVLITNPELPDLTLTSFDIVLDVLCTFSRFVDSQTICESESIQLGTRTLNSSNPLDSFLFTDQNGCDSMVVLSLAILEEMEDFVNDIICENDSLIINGELFTANKPSGVVSELESNGCESRTFVDLDILFNSRTPIDTFYCVLESSISINNFIYERAGDFQQSLTASNGCDSILLISIQERGIGDPCNDNNPETDFDRYREGCICLGEPSCFMPDLFSDEIVVKPGEEESIDFLRNDKLPTDFQFNIISEIPNIVITNRNPLVFTIREFFVDDILVEYEVCDASCDACSTEFITIKNEELQNIVQTNAFTPNGTGRNNLLRFSNEEVIENSELWIYNRWGTQIYNKKNYTNDWDGGGYPDGVYFYVLKIGETVIKKTLTILR